MRLKQINQAVMWLPGFAPDEDPLVVLGTACAAKSSLVIQDEPEVNVAASAKGGWKRMDVTDLLSINGSVAKYRANMAAIDLLTDLEQSGRQPDDDERRVLNQYTGWGGLPQAFNAAQADPIWAAYSAELRQRLSEKEHAAAEASTLNAHFTPPEVIRAVWDMVRRLGFQGGNILEPAAGTGFFLANMPEDMAAASQLTVVEPDHLSARILGQLYRPHGVKVMEKGFEEIAVPHGVYDLVISNVPFGNYQVAEHRNVPFADYVIHDYFFGRALELARAGGMVAFITSTGTMDKHGDHVRAYLASQAELVAAIRLPHGTFKQVAGTDTGADLLILKKPEAGKPNANQAWVKSAYTSDYGNYIAANAYWQSNPDMVLGKLHTTSGRYGYELRCSLQGDLVQELERVTGLLPAGIYQPKAKPAAKPKAVRDLQVIELDGNQRSGFFVMNGKVFESDGVTAIEVDATGKLLERLTGLCEVRDAARRLIQVQLSTEDDAKLVPYQIALNVAYDKLVKSCGPINNVANRRAFKHDPDMPLLLSLEYFDEETKTATKAEIFDKRTLRAYRKVEACDTPAEAFTVCLGEVGEVDPQRIAELVGMEQEAVMATLELDGLVFHCPDENKWVPAFLYLSGNVRKKHLMAVYAGDRYKRNAEALAALIPADLEPNEIGARIGSNWIPASDYAAYLNELCGVDSVSVTYSAAAGAWEVEYGYQASNSVNAKQVYGTSRINALELFVLAMNQRVPEIKDRDPFSEKYVLNRPETIAAREKQEDLKSHFLSWLWADMSRAARLVRVYNDTFNSTVAPVYDGSHLKLPGYSYSLIPRQHQLDVVWRGLVSGTNLLLGHDVGAGKTLEMILLGMEMRRMGKASRPMYVCPNHMLLQFAAEFVRAYPTAKLLMATKDDLVGDRRRVLMSRIATGDWDGIVLTHSSFERIALSSDYVLRHIENEIEEIETAIRATKGSQSNRLVKELARAKKQWQVKLEKLDGKAKKDDGLTFEDLGVDQLMVDEAHLFKSLFRFSKMNRVAGLSSGNSERAFDMYLKTRYIMDQRGSDSGVCFATGTFVANTMAEAWVMQKFLQPTRLAELNVLNFDDWAANFGEVVTALELAPDGRGYRVNSRFAKFVNLPELMSVFAEVADIRTAAMLNLPRPEAVWETVVSEPTQQQKMFVESLVRRADAIRDRKVSSDKDNMLSVTGDGRLAALDMRLLGVDIEEGGDRKVRACIEKVAMHWRDSESFAGTQLIFCDTGTPGGSARFNVYQAVKDGLMAEGIPEKEIAFIHDFDSDAAKEALFQSVRAGQVRVVIGSTSKMGTGVNVQKRLVALHHLDAPWRPADIEQREGRILRQGNMNTKVFIYRYVTEMTFDSYIWQTLEAKQRFIVQIKQGDRAMRSAEDMSLSTLSFAEVKALASGNPLVLEKAGIDAELAKLALLKTQWSQAQWRNRNTVATLPNRIAARKNLVANIQSDINNRQASGDFMLPNGQRLNADQAGGYILKQSRGLEYGDKLLVGSYRGMAVNIVGANIVDDRRVEIAGKASFMTRLTRESEFVVPTLDRLFSNMEAQLADEEHAIATMVKELAETEEILAKPFDKADRLAWLEQRQREIEDALDLTKGDNTAVEEDAPELVAA